jgi:DNA polymerase-1
VRGFGPKTAAKLLAAFATADEAFTEAATDGERCRAAVGKALAATLATSEARAAFQVNRAVMTMHRDVPLGLDIPRGVGRLPLDPEVVRTVLARFDLRTPSLVRALTGAEPTEPRPVDVDSTWRPPRVRSAARFPPLPKQPEPDPTLF